MAWTLASGVAAIAIGVATSSLVLVAFGATGATDAAGSVTLVWHFRHAIRSGATSEDRERVAQRIVGVGLLVVGLGAVVESSRRLVAGGHADSVWAGAALAAVSALVLAVLAMQKMRLATRVASPALRADGALSATGAALAALAVVGSLLPLLDSTAAFVVGLIAAVTGVRTIRQ